MAETEETKESAYRLIHNAYVGAGFISPQPDGMRRPHNADTTDTITLVAKIGQKVVGTISLMKPHNDRFPMEPDFNLGQLPFTRNRVAEVGALAVDLDYRKTRGTVLFPLFRAILDYSREVLNIDQLIITYNPKFAELYECLLLFKRIPGTKKIQLSSVEGAPALASYLDLKLAPALFRNAYGVGPRRHNFYNYLFVREAPCIKFPANLMPTTERNVKILGQELAV